MITTKLAHGVSCLFVCPYQAEAYEPSGPGQFFFGVRPSARAGLRKANAERLETTSIIPSEFAICSLYQNVEETEI